jgi:hypothetical protein
LPIGLSDGWSNGAKALAWFDPYCPKKKTGAYVCKIHLSDKRKNEITTQMATKHKGNKQEKNI